MVKVPCARDRASGNIVFATTAVKKRKHTCLECDIDVVVHRGPKRVAHFAHVTSHGGHCTGGGESAMHHATKEWIKTIACDPTFVVWTTCATCYTAFDVFRGQANFDARVEYRWNNGQYVLDVAIAAPERLCTVIEVLHTHAAGPTKRKTIEASDYRPLPVMEIKAVDLVATNWPRRFECISPRRCSACLMQAYKLWLGRFPFRQVRIDAWFDAALKNVRQKRMQRDARARALDLVRAANEKNKLRFAAAEAAALEIGLVAALDSVIDALVEKTKSIARQWLFRSRCRSLVARLRKRCLVCGELHLSLIHI